MHNSGELMEYARLTIALTKEDRQKIRELAARNNMSSAAWIKNILVPYLEDMKEPPHSKKHNKSVQP